MNTKIHRYYHKLKIGKVIDIIVDLTTDIPMFTSDKTLKGESGDAIIEEYIDWVDSITPEILEFMSKEQKIYAVTKGFNLTPNN